MAFQQVEDTVSIELRLTVDGTPIENIFYAKKEGGYTQPQLQALADAVEEWYVTELRPFLSNDTIYREVYVKGLNDAADVQATANAEAGAAGSGGTGMPANVAKAVKLSTGLTGRNARGRVFIGGMSTTALAGRNHIVQGFADDLIAALEALKLVITGLSFIWVIVSRYKDGVKRATGETFEVTEVGVTNLTTDSMRGRLPKV